MTSPGTENTEAAEGDQPVEKSEGSSKDAIQNPTVDASQDRESVPVKKRPVLELSTVVTRNNLEDFAELIREIDLALLPPLKKRVSVRDILYDIYSHGLGDASMVSPRLFGGLSPTWNSIPPPCFFSYSFIPIRRGTHERPVNHEDAALGIEFLETAAKCVASRIAPLVQKAKATSGPKKGD